MTTPAPEKSTRRRRPRRQPPALRPRLRLGFTGWIVSWLLPTAVMGGLLLGLSFVPGLDDQGFLTPLIPLIGGAAVGVGIPGTLLVSWLYRHHLNPVVHVLGYVVVGLLYGPIVLLAGTGGLIPMLIPLVGFPAGMLLGVGRWAAQPLATVEDPAEEDPVGAPDGGEAASADDGQAPDDDSAPADSPAPAPTPAAEGRDDA